MNPLDDAPIARPNAREINDLKRLAGGIVTAQGNRFIKELLREKNLRIGETKDDFLANLTKAIEAGDLRLADVEEWLARVEGWGNQHVYLYNISTTLRRELTGPKINERVQRNAELRRVWNASTVLPFPDEPELTSVSFEESVLRLIWQEASPGWVRASSKDYEEEEGLDTYKYEASRKLERRVITRFEAHLKKGLAALFIPGPIQNEEHEAAIAEVKRVIALLMSLDVLERGQFEIGIVSRNFDQQNLPNNANPAPPIRTRRSRLTAGGAYVEFASNSAEGAFWEEPAVMEVRNAVHGPILDFFQGTEGVFIFQPGAPGALDRSLRVQLHANGNRIRLWAQMDADEVWTILEKIGEYQ